MRGGMLLPRWRPLAVGVVVSSLAVTVGLVAQPQLASAATAVAQHPRTATAADLVSAQVTAKAQGARVEVESLRTETSTTWVNPDRSLTTEEHAGPIRYRDSAGLWQNVDLQIADSADGSSRPKGSRMDVSFAGRSKGARGSGRSAAGTDLASVEEGNGKTKASRRVAIVWPGLLPAPTIEGTRATYGEVKPGIDVVLESRRSGFEQLTIVKDRAALGRLTATDGNIAVSLPLATQGLTARVEDDQSVSFVDSTGAVASRIAPPVAWDAVVDRASGNHPNVTPIAVAVAQKGQGKAVLTLTPDQKWLADPSRVFPITIDPTYATGSNVTTSFDTYVQKDKTWDTSAETELRVGTSDGGSSIVARSFLNFPLSSIQGKQIMSASLSIYETWSYSCTARAVTAYSAGPAASTSTRWTNQPTVLGSASSLTVAKGYSSSCAAGRISIPITGIVQDWAATTWANGTLRLSASETDNLGWKKFASRETSNDPYITYTYNRKPNPGAAPTITPGYSYTPPSGTAAVYTSALKPTLKSTATDPDGNKVLFKIEVHSNQTGSALVTSCTTALVASGGTGSCVIPANLTNNTEYFARTAVQDDQGLWNGTWSTWTTLRVGASQPAAPVISCPSPYLDGDTVATVPGSPIACTVTAVGTSWSAPSAIKVSKDGGTAASVPITPSSNTTTAKATVTIANTSGTRQLSVVAVSPAQVSSTNTNYVVTLGGATMTTPAQGTSSTGSVPVLATVVGPSQGKLQYRLAGSNSGAWTDDPATITFTIPDATRPTVKEARGSWNLASISGTNISTRVPVTFEARLCYTTGANPTTCDSATAPTRVVRLPSAFGAGYPVDDSSGAGSVAQFTGEFATSASDVSIGTLGVGRSYASFSGSQSTDDPVRGVFGPGWTGEFGTVSGRAGWTVSDTTYADGTISFTDPDSGTVLAYAQSTASRTYPAAGATYAAVNTAATDSDAILSFARTGTAATLSLKDADGTTSTWTATLPTGTPTAALTWTPSSVTEPADTLTAHTYLYPDSSGRVGRVVDVPIGRVSNDCPNAATWVVDATHNPQGCSALDVTYGATGATAPDAPGQVKSITARIWNPDTLAVDSTPMATYQYDSARRLVAVTDARTTLTTRYSWDGASTRLATITPPGQAPFRVYYDTTYRVKLITRDSASAGTWTTTTLTTPPAGSSALARYAYAISPNGNGTALPDLSAATTAQWNQRSPMAPTSGYAVFGPDFAWDGTTTVNAPSSNSTSWQYAGLAYTTPDGYTVNSATYGAGKWLPDVTLYDAQGRGVWSLTPGAVRKIAASTAVEDPAAVDAMATTTTYSSSGMVTETYEPAHDVYLGYGLWQSMRRHTGYLYDQGAPNSNINPDTGDAYGLVTAIVAAIAYPDGRDYFTSQSTKYGYAALVPGDKTGWELGLPTTTTQVDFLNGGAGNIVHSTRYDTSGRVIETRQPKATSTADAGTTITDYFTGTGAMSTPCQGRPEWDGLVCRIRPGAAAVGGTGLPEIPTKWYAYDKWGATTVTEKTSADITLRTTTSSSDSAGRTSAVAISAVVSGSTARPGQTFAYSSSTGLPTSIATTGTTTQSLTGYDGWGRPTSYTNSLGEVTTTTYGSNGMVSSVHDPIGDQTFTWNGTDANGAIEQRGFPTKLTVSRAGIGGSLEYTAAYDADDNLILQTMPGALRLKNTYDEIGQLTEQSYTGQVTPVTEATDADGNTVYTPGTPLQDQTWMTWSRRYDNHGRVMIEWNGAGSAFDGVPGVSKPADILAPSVGRALASDKLYGYDWAGRLTYVADRTATSTGTTLEPYTDWGADSPCVVRQYTFDNNGNRASLSERGNIDGNCWGTATPTTRTYDYDTADRPISGTSGSGAYSYDALGRQTSIPSADTPAAAPGNAGITYFDDDLVRSLQQGQTSTTYMLDPESRRLDETSSTPSSTTVVQRHYSDSSDNPAWVSVTQGATQALTRLSESLTSSVSADISGDGSVVLSLTNPHGDRVTSVLIGADSPNSLPASAINGWSAFDEYGRAAQAPSADAIGYSFLASAQRSTTAASLGLTLMGLRVFNSQRGLFTSVDPVQGGNEASYGYPNDPINRNDVSGALDYTMWFDLGRTYLTASSFFSKVRASFTSYFPIPGAKALRLGQRMTLRPRGAYFPLHVATLVSNGWTFATDKGHPDYNGYISFRFYKSSGRMSLKVHGYVPWWSVGGQCLSSPVCRAGYLWEARNTWSQFATRLRGLAARYRTD